MNSRAVILPDTPDSLKEIVIAQQGEIVDLRARHDKETSLRPPDLERLTLDFLLFSTR